jgi:hypothetical protein
MISGAPPAANGQMSVIGRAGQVSAFADGRANRTDATHASAQMNLGIRFTVAPL